MRIVLAAALLAALSCPKAEAADLQGPTPFARGDGGLRYGEIWDEADLYRPGRSRPARRVTGGSDYVGSVYGLGKPSYSGVGPRPDWGRSSHD